MAPHQGQFSGDCLSVAHGQRSWPHRRHPGGGTMSSAAPASTVLPAAVTSEFSTFLPPRSPLARSALLLTGPSPSSGIALGLYKSPTRTGSTSSDLSRETPPTENRGAHGLMTDRVRTRTASAESTGARPRAEAPRVAPLQPAPRPAQPGTLTPGSQGRHSRGRQGSPAVTRVPALTRTRPTRV